MPSILKLKKEYLVLLPGLDGTGRLFRPLLNVMTGEFEPGVVTYPPDKRLSYEQLFPLIREVMPWDAPYTLVAESLAGPLALRFAAEQRGDIKAIVLCASFVRNPLHPMFAWTHSLLRESLFQKPLPPAILKKFFAGNDCPPPLLDAIKEAIGMVRPEVLAHRVRLALETDAREALRSLEKPILYLQAAQDEIVGRRGLEEIQSIKPAVVSVVIDGPHLLLQRRPKEAFAAIREFLADK